MRLTREERGELLAGRYPRLTYPGVKPCPIEKGEVYWISSLRSLVVTGVRRSRKGEWVVVYEIHQQEPALFLASRPPKAATQRDRDRFTEEQAKGYTHSRSQALDPAEAVPPDEISDYRYSRQAQARFSQERSEQAAELLQACEDVRAAADGLDPEIKRTISREVWTLKGRIDALERKLRRRAAA